MLKPPFSVYDAEKITRTPFETFRKERDDPQSASERSKGAVNTPSITGLHLLNFAENVMATSSKKIIPGLLKRLNKQEEDLKALEMRLKLAGNGGRTMEKSWFKRPSRGLSTCTSSGSVTKVGFCIGTSFELQTDLPTSNTVIAIQGCYRFTIALQQIGIGIADRKRGEENGGSKMTIWWSEMILTPETNTQQSSMGSTLMKESPPHSPRPSQEKKLQASASPSHGVAPAAK
nr:uncharacterized protein LOC109189132 [Ipomoea batatas]